MQTPHQSAGNWPLWLSGALFALYAGNILVGKISIMTAGDVVGMGDVAEFLTLFGAAASFAVAVLIKEQEEEAGTSPPEKQT